MAHGETDVIRALARWEDGLCTVIDVWREAGSLACQAGVLEPTGERVTVAGWFGLTDPTPAEVHTVGGVVWDVLIILEGGKESPL